MTASIRVTSLGALELLRDGTPRLAGRRKLLLLVALLARRQPRPVLRTELASWFWPESDEARARQSLRQALVELRQVLGEALVVGDQDLRLDIEIVELDANRFEQLLTTGDLAAADQLWNGDFLAGAELDASESFRSWLESEREHLRHRRAFLGERLVESAEKRGAWSEALQHAERWSRALPSDEAAAAKLQSLQALADRREPARPGGGALLTPDLIAREADFAILTGIWERVQRGSPGLGLIEGEDGSGKSRLLEEFLRWARRRDPRVLVLRARAFAAEQDRQLLLARHLLAPLAAAPGVSAAPASALRALANLAPEFAERFSGLPAGSPDALPEAVSRVLAEVASEVRLIIAVDDAHLADPVSREVLEALYRRPPGGVLILLTTAPGLFALADLERRPPAAGQLLRVRLGSFDQDELERLLASMAEFRPVDRRALAIRLLAETGGNPLAAVELTTALADHGVVGPAPDGSWIATLPPADHPLPLPTTLVETLKARIAGLSPDATRVLQAASVLGRLIDDPLLGQLTGLDPEQLDTAMSELLSRRLLRPDPEGDGRFEFNHEALRRIVYEGLTPTWRRTLHGTALDTLRRRGARDSGMQAAIAHHQVRVGPSRRRTWQWLSAAAVVAVLAIAAILVSQRSDRKLQLLVGRFTVDGGDREIEHAVGEAMHLALDHASSAVVLDEPGSDSIEPRGRRIVVEGKIRREGSSLHLEGVTRQGEGPQTLSHASVDGEVALLPQLTATLAQKLFTDRIHEVPFELSAARSASIPALRNYFSGVRQSRSRDFETAAQSFWQATRQDPNFALAWHALSRINGWFFLGDRAARMADSALAHDRELLPHEQLILLGWREFSYGRAEEAEARFRQVLSFSRENVEARIGLAEVLYHHNWTRGRSPVESRELWDAVTTQDPTDWRPGVHRWELAAFEHRWERAETLLAQSAAANRDTSAITRFLLLQLHGGADGLEQAITKLPADNEWSMMQLASWEGTALGRLDLARACLSRLTEPSHSREVQALGHEQLAWVELAEGKWRTAQEEVVRAGALEPVSAATSAALLWVAPFLPASLTDSGRVAAQRRLGGAPLHPVNRSFLFWLDYDRGREALVRQYLTELLARQRGDRANYPSLSLGGPGAVPDSVYELQQQLQRSAVGWQRWAEGDSPGLVQQLESGWNGSEATRQEISLFWARPWDLYQLALEIESTRPEQAANLLGNLGTLSLATLPYMAPALLERGRILEKLGRTDDAISAYQTGLALWRSPDPEFVPWAAEARGRLTALEKR